MNLVVAEEESNNLSDRSPSPIIRYGDSELLKALKNYDIEPNESIKRKIDYYYSPYGAIK